MRPFRAILAIVLSLALFVQGVAASAMRSCHMGPVMATQAHTGKVAHAHHEMDEDMAMASVHEDVGASHHTAGRSEGGDASKSSERSSCAFCAACCMGFALPVSYSTPLVHFVGARTVFPPLAVAPPSRLPGGWDRPPRA